MGNKNTVGAILAFVYTAGFLAVIAFMFWGRVPAENKDFFNFALGALIGFAGTGVQYFLGSSKGTIAPPPAPALPPGDEPKLSGS